MSAMAMTTMRTLCGINLQRCLAAAPSAGAKGSGQERQHLRQHLLHTSASDPASQLPGMPKKPATAFSAFLRDQYPSLKASLGGGDSSVKESVRVTQLAAEKWREASQEDRDKYKERYRRDLEAFNQRRAQVEEALAKEDKLESAKAKVEEERTAEALRRASLKKKRLAAELGQPRQPKSAYNFYVQEQFRNEPGLSGRKAANDKMRAVAESWKGLGEEGRAKYVAMEQKAKENYGRYMLTPMSCSIFHPLFPHSKFPP